MRKQVLQWYTYIIPGIYPLDTRSLSVGLSMSHRAKKFDRKYKSIVNGDPVLPPRAHDTSIPHATAAAVRYLYTLHLNVELTSRSYTLLICPTFVSRIYIYTREGGDVYRARVDEEAVLRLHRHEAVRRR